jgi:hypothetical protein
MTNIVRREAAASMRAFALTIVVAAVAACGTMQFRAGNPVDPAALERSLKTGTSTQADVKAALGAPYGQGAALMPFHDAERTVWTYFYERGSVDVSTMATQDKRTYLFVFFVGDRLDGYMWFASEIK